MKEGKKFNIIFEDKYNPSTLKIKEEKKLEDAYILTKISDDIFKGAHPNAIDEGYIKLGIFKNPPTVGEVFHIYNPNRLRDQLYTSIVTKVIDDTTFKTKNSTYKLEKYEN